MVDVARRVGVSQKTVSRVINGAPHVRPEVRERVLAAVAELGYRPNVSARALVMRRTHLIGVLAVGTAYFGPANRVFSLEQVARESGYELALSSLPDMSPAPLRGAIQTLLGRGCEGIVLELPTQSVDIDEGLLGGVPVATNVGRLPNVSRQAVVNSDQTEAGRLATEHLLELGHRTVWHLAGPFHWDAALQRRAGWAAALTAAGRRRPRALVGDWSARSGYHLGRKLAARKDVTAVFAANDHQAMGLLRALREHGKSVPEDVSVVGFDDVPEAEYQVVPLTTVRGDADAVSHQVLSALVRLIEGGEPNPETAAMSWQLVQRASTGAPRGSGARSETTSRDPPPRGRTRRSTGPPGSILSSPTVGGGSLAGSRSEPPAGARQPATAAEGSPQHT